MHIQITLPVIRVRIFLCPKQQKILLKSQLLYSLPEFSVKLPFPQHVPSHLFPLIFQELLRYRGEEPQSDDITMLAFCRPDPEPETTTLSVEAHAARPGRPTNPNQTGDTGQ